jgi:phenylalanyl-tRNA synthetase alpha chain
MQSVPPPIYMIMPGRVFRNETTDATHLAVFHQLEGLVIDRGITLGHLKGCLTDFLRAFFGISNLPVRFRSSYFPFTEPSMEVDIGWNRKTGELGAGGDWLEILGSGMVHPRVLANCGIDAREWQGFAFGMGIERITMLKHGIADLRPFYEGDVRWLAHYASSPLTPASLHEGV